MRGVGGGELERQTKTQEVRQLGGTEREGMRERERENERDRQTQKERERE